MAHFAEKAQNEYDCKSVARKWQIISQRTLNNNFEIRTSGKIVDLLGKLGRNSDQTRADWPKGAIACFGLFSEMCYLPDEDELQIVWEDVSGNWDAFAAYDLELLLSECFDVSSVNLVVIAPDDREPCEPLFRGAASGGDTSGSEAV